MFSKLKTEVNLLGIYGNTEEQVRVVILLALFWHSTITLFETISRSDYIPNKKSRLWSQE